MADLTFIRFTETNDNEGEVWHFWLQADGNRPALERLGDLLDAAATDGYDCYKLTDVEMDEAGVDLLVANCESGYMDYSNKVVGTLVIPDEFDIDSLYKGGIRDLFEAVSGE
ncbi:hypothetical protein ACTWPB_07500 [Nocardia sp. IBHARD005]|uniref:hypothetical protein n=1 Tax=Nocardia sp. IBHARD005 TaxID=3457765 RepID=UPI004058DC67